MIINEEISSSVQVGISELNKLGLDVSIDRDASSYLGEYFLTQSKRPGRILDIERSKFNPNSFYRLVCRDGVGEVLAYCAARVIPCPNGLAVDAKHLPPPLATEEWGHDCFMEIKGRDLHLIKGRTLYLGGLWVRPQAMLPQLSMLMPRLLAGAVVSKEHAEIDLIWGIVNTRKGVHLASIYGFDNVFEMELWMHRYVGKADQKLNSHSHMALSWASRKNYMAGLAAATA
ncbi:hypothetical protein ACSFBX_35305 [Variovorax sp. RB2P76]|uniref:hypothetical protein n=1 Tax=Variovorax sp. RB2P76 TaxID=3443736 RepID=UPI003F44A263